MLDQDFAIASLKWEAQEVHWPLCMKSISK